MATIDTDVNTSISFEVTASPFSFRCYFKNYILGARKPSYHQKMVMFSMVSAFYFSCVSFLQLLNEVKAMKFYFLHEIQLQASLIWLTLNIFWFFNFFNEQILLWDPKHSIFHFMSHFSHCNNILIGQGMGKTSCFIKPGSQS